MRSTLPPDLDVAVKRAALEFSRLDYKRHRAALRDHARRMLEEGKPAPAVAAEIARREAAARLGPLYLRAEEALA